MLLAWKRLKSKSDAPTIGLLILGQTPNWFWSLVYYSKINSGNNSRQLVGSLCTSTFHVFLFLCILELFKFHVNLDFISCHLQINLIMWCLDIEQLSTLGIGKLKFNHHIISFATSIGVFWPPNSWWQEGYEEG